MLVAVAAVAAAAAVAAGLPPLGEAVRAVDRLVAPRLEGDLRLLATVAAHRRVHLALRAVIPTRAIATAVGIAAATLLRLARAPAVWAAPGLVDQPTLLVELLLTGGPDEFLPTIAAGQCFVLEAQFRTLSRKLTRFATVE